VDTGKSYKINEKQLFYTPLKPRKLSPFLSNGTSQMTPIKTNGQVDKIEMRLPAVHRKVLEAYHTSKVTNQWNYIDTFQTTSLDSQKPLYGNLIKSRSNCKPHLVKS